MRFLATFAAAAVAGVVASWLINGFTGSSVGTLINVTAALPIMQWPLVAVHIAFSAAVWFWPKRKTEPLLITLTAALLLTTALWNAHAPAFVTAIPWLILTLIGGASSRARVRLPQHF